MGLKFADRIFLSADMFVKIRPIMGLKCSQQALITGGNKLKSDL